MAGERETGDPNMRFALRFAEGLGRVATLPSSLVEVEKRVSLVERLDGPFLAGENPDAILANLGRRIRELAELPDLDDPLARVSIGLRLWAGCLGTARAIAVETTRGANTRALRGTAFTAIDELAQSDRIFAAGLEAAPRFMQKRKRRYSFEGVPAGSSVRRGESSP